ncbi:MAG TPA: hypothetical protein VLV83_09415, partial [Acidobacteriota bacterium]|nr:hypothetical protein [Acidobacteriota bacterium]
MRLLFPSLRDRLSGSARRRWLPPATALFLLTVAAAALGWQALRERDRAERTVEMLLHDYASFVSQRLRQESADHYRHCSGQRPSILSSEDSPSGPAPFASVRSWAAGQEPDAPGGPDWVRYYFRFHAASGSLEYRGSESPTSIEEEQLRQALAAIPVCAPDQTLIWPALNASGQPGAAEVESGSLPSWGVLLHTDSLGGI